TYLHPKTSKKSMKISLNTQFDELQKSPLEYLDVVEDFYNAYCEVLEMQDRHAHLLSYLEDNYWRAILCASILHDYSESKIEDLKELLVKFYYQHWVAKKPKDQREQTCCNIIKALKEKKSMEHIVSIAIKNLDEYSVTQHFKENLRDSHVYKKQSTKNPYIKPILILVEYFMSDDPKPKRIQMDRNLHVEHILPQNPTLSSQWAKDFSEEERERYTHSLANLTLLGGKRNIDASNLDFKDKKKIYMGEEIKLDKKKPFRVMTCYKMTIDIAHNYTEWTPKSLEKREKDLMSIIESVLTL
ncbi:HNH endonuclease family protein, partial [Helicobacter pylori]